MRTQRFIHFILGFALAAIPASATITYSNCNSGCGASGGDYAGWQSQFATSGQTLTATSQLSFAAADLSGSPTFYTDPTTGALFYGYNNTSLDSLNVSGTQLTQTISGTGTSIEVSLQGSTTYAITFVIGASSFANPWIELVSSPSNLNTSTNAQYQAIIPNSTSPQFFGIVSDTPITSLFVWNYSGGGALNLQSFESGTESTPSTPETSTFLLMGGGLGGLCLLRRHRAA